MELVKVLAIAPYDGLRDILISIAQEFPQIELTSLVGDLEKGAEIALEHLSSSNYDVIISRGGTAEMIRSVSSLPLLELPTTVSDILHAIKLAENYRDSFCIIGFSSITQNAHLVCELLQYDIPIFTIHKDNTTDETMNHLERLKQSGYSMILCDVVTMRLAHRCGLNAVLITSNDGSIRQIFTLVIQMFTATHSTRSQNLLLQATLAHLSSKVAVFSKNGDILYSNFTSHEKELELHVQKITSQYLGQFPTSLSHIENDHWFNIHLQQIDDVSGSLIVANVEQQPAPLHFTKNGVTICNFTDNLSDDSFSNFSCYFSNSNTADDIYSKIMSYGKSNFPVIILGEKGSGKDSSAILLYENSALRHNPFYRINCEIISEKQWASLINTINSPLQGTNATIYFKFAQFLTSKQVEQLLILCESSALMNRNRLVFSFMPQSDAQQCSLYQELLTNYSVLLLDIPPLRDRASDIPSLTTLYLNGLNLQIGKQIIGFDSNALVLLQQFPWPGNFDQFKRILRELAITTTGFYISYAATEHALSKESLRSVAPSNTSGGHVFDISKSLADITSDIVHAVLQEEKGKKKNAAERLGISRSTIWRILQDSEVPEKD